MIKYKGVVWWRGDERMYSEGSDGDAVPYNEFVSLARDEGLVALEVLVVQAPGEGNGHTAVVQATARTRDGSFGAVGEASPASAPAAWRPFLTTLAELRAKARALRDMTGLEHAVQEELSVPYRVAGADEDREPLPSRGRPPVPAALAAPAAAPVIADEPDEPVDLSSIPGLQRGIGGMKLATRTSPTPPMSPAVPALRLSPPQQEDDEEEPDDRAQPDDDETPDGADEGTRRSEAPRISSAPAAPRMLAEAPAPSLVDEGPIDYEAVPPDMLDKLKRLAVSIARLEGTELSDAQAILKLDDFFMRAFRRPLGRATRMEGQRVVQKLSSDLSKRRAAANAEADDE